MSQVTFDLELARIVALADNGHTAYYASSRSSRSSSGDGGAAGARFPGALRAGTRGRLPPAPMPSRTADFV